MEEIRFSPHSPPECAFLSMKGSHGLDGRGLVVLPELVVFRDAQARRWGVPPYRIVSNDTLLFLDRNPDGGLSDAPGIGESAMRRIGGGLQEALREGRAAEPVSRPKPAVPPEPRPTRFQAERFKALRQWRIQLAEELSLDPTLLWPMASLERLARSPRTLDGELSSAEVRRWQRAEFGDRIRQRLAGLQAKPSLQEKPSLLR